MNKNAKIIIESPDAIYDTTTPTKEEDVDVMPTFSPEQIDEVIEVVEKENIANLISTPSPEMSLDSKVTQPMRKFTYSLRTTASPVYYIRNQLPETPTSYYQYSAARTGLPQVKSLPPLIRGYPPPAIPVQVISLIIYMRVHLQPVKLVHEVYHLYFVHNFVGPLSQCSWYAT